VSLFSSKKRTTDADTTVSVKSDNGEVAQDVVEAQKEEGTHN
jgi:hypothetical protein